LVRRRTRVGPVAPEGLIFADRDGGPLQKENFSRDSWAKVRKRAGVTIRFHDLRHTAATLLLTNGTDLGTTADRLGHANAKTTLGIYSHALPGRNKRPQT
jgi:integrase